MRMCVSLCVSVCARLCMCVLCSSVCVCGFDEVLLSALAERRQQVAGSSPHSSGLRAGV